MAATKMGFSVFSDPSSLNTETTEDLCIKFFLVREDTEPRTGGCRLAALLVQEEIFARRQEVWE
jgi:hypothetical protein